MLIFVGLFVLATAMISSRADAGDMDLMLKRIVSESAGPEAARWSKATVQTIYGTAIPCLVKSSDPSATADAIRLMGGSAGEIGGGIISALIPREAVEGIVSRPEVSVAEAALPLSRKMDTARSYSGVNVVQNGTALGVAYKGKNVVVGVVDDGLDYGNEDFTGSSGTTRLQYVRQMGGTTALECTRRTIANSTCGIEDRGQGTVHGTNVTGIASGRNSTYTGVAPEADIMFVFANPTDPNTSGTGSSSFATIVLDGVTKIFEKATTIDKAAVVNLSLGTSIGAHDGTSLLEQGLTALTTAKPGRIVVNAAGNEQTIPAEFAATVRNFVGGIHAQATGTAGAGNAWRLAIWNGSGAASATGGGTTIDLWLDAGQKDTCSVAVLGFTGGRATNPPDPLAAAAKDAANNVFAFAPADIPFAADTTKTATGGGVTASIAIAASDPRNSKPHATILLTPANGSPASTLETMWFDVVLRSTGASPCTGHMWLYFDYAAYHDFLKGVAGTAVAAAGAIGAYTLADGDTFYTTTIPSTATGVISAGSWMPPKPIGSTKSEWTADNGNTYDQSNLNAPGGTGSMTSDLSDFSSLGPTADGRAKPDVVAPGEPIISTKARGSSVSSSLTVGGSHFKEAGTSMASPHVAGIVALLLERNNTLTLDQVRTALRTGAATSGMTAKTANPENSYGAGKVNAAAVLGSVAIDTSLYKGTGDLEAPESSGCALLPGSGRALDAAVVIAFITALGASLRLLIISKPEEK